MVRMFTGSHDDLIPMVLFVFSRRTIGTKADPKATSKMLKLTLVEVEILKPNWAGLHLNFTCIRITLQDILTGFLKCEVASLDYTIWDGQAFAKRHLFSIPQRYWKQFDI